MDNNAKTTIRIPTRSRWIKGAVALVGATATLLGGVGLNAAPSTGATAQAQLPAIPGVPGSSATQVPFGFTQVGLGMAPSGCAAHIVVNVPGGANTTSNLPTRLPIGPYTAQAGQALRAKHPGKVVDRYVSYRSTPGGAFTYEQTRDGGYRKARALIAREAAACPGATFSLIGYSMGSDIASRIVNDIAYGRGPISADRFDSAVFIANPNRSAMAEVAHAGGAPRSDGAFGELQGSYGKLGDRVLEVCRRGDLVCDTPRSAAPLSKAIARSAILAGIAPLTEAKMTVDRLSPRERAAFYASMPQLAVGQSIHTNYNAVNGAGRAIGYIDRHLGTAGRNPETAHKR
ncbi:cutinase family protein [uncultured Corynebacterium sp.]|uniref:cutinase family protein n=1 Tax=uncultured Corynebacterium sp. TaxID=159447 RepID=UPI0025D8409B|nr:cutinase family protein [uncultured Corynebacterium sp.]